MSSKKYMFCSLILLSGLTGLRLLTGAYVGLGDVEAYYWTWSRALDLSFYDHGPLVALFIRLGTFVLGPTPLGVRWPFILLSTATLWLVGRGAYRLAASGASMARRTEDAAPLPNPSHQPEPEAAQCLAMLAMSAMPAFFVAGGAANPDVPFLFATALFGLVILSRPPTRPGAVLIAGLLVGAAMAAKYFGIGLLIPLLAWIRSGPRPARRPLLLPLIALAATLPGVLPVLLWNTHNGLASFLYHLDARHSQPVGPSWLNLGKLLGGQLGYYSPPVLIGLFAALVWLWRRRAEDPISRCLLWASWPMLLVGGLLILLIPGAEPHWTAAGYLPLVMALGAMLPPLLRRSRLGRILAGSAAILGFIVAVGFEVHVLTDLGVRLMPASYQPRYDLSNELHGWPTVADTLAQQVRKLTRSRSKPLVAACHYTTCSQLRFAARGRFAVVCPSPRIDQFDFEPGGDGSMQIGKNLLYLWDERFPFSTEKLYSCKKQYFIKKINITRASRIVRKFKIFYCLDFQGLATSTWPPS